MRTVGVKVLADSAQYERAMLESGVSTDKLAKSMDRAADEARDLTRATNEARTAALEQAAAERAAATATERSAAAAKKASRAQIEAGAAAENAAEAAQKLERGEITAAEAQKLAAAAARKDRDAQIANAAAQRAAAIETEKLERAAIKASVAQLAQGKAARAAGAVAGSRGLSREQGGSLLRNLVGNGTIVGKEAAQAFVEGFQSTAKTASKSLMTDLEAVVGSAGEVLWPALIGAAVGAAPFVASAVGGAVLAGVGGIGIGAAIAGQVNNPVVRTAWSDLAAYAKEDLAQATQGIEQPLVDAAHIFGRALELSTGDFQSMVDELAPAIDHLAHGFASGFQNVLSVLPEVAHEAKPIIDLIANQLPRAGIEIGDFLKTISQDSRGAGEGLAILFRLFGGGLKVLGETILGAEVAVDSFFQQVYTVIKLASKIPGPFQDTFKHLARNMEDLFDTSDKAAHGLDGFGDSADKASSKTQSFNEQLKDASDQFDTLVNSALAASNADLAFRDALANVTKAVQENGTSLDVHTAKGRANIAMFNDLIGKAEADRQANIANGMSVDEANKKFDEQVNQIYKQAAAAGYSKKQIDALFRSLGLIPEKKEFNVYAKGADGALRLLQSIHYYLDSLHNKQFTVTTYYETKNGQAQRGSSSYGGGGRAEADGGILDFRAYANGGMYEPSHVASIVPAGTYRVMAEPETGGEAYIPLAASKRTRSVDVWEQAGERLGVTPTVLAASAPSVHLQPQFDVRVMIGSQDITKMVDVRITEHDRQTNRGVTSGRRR